MNCGVCGFPGCNEFAAAVLREEVDVEGCKAGGIEVAQDVAKVMGVSLDKEIEGVVAVVNCAGRQNNVEDRFIYDGLANCDIANSLAGGQLACVYGCLGGGDCIEACPLEAISFGDNNSIIIDKKECVGCGACVTSCPRNIITLIPTDKNLTNLCSNRQKGKLVRKVCTVGCIACKACEKVCEAEAIKMEEFLAIIDYEKCDECAKCVEKCPTDCLVCN